MAQMVIALSRHVLRRINVNYFASSSYSSGDHNQYSFQVKDTQIAKSPDILMNKIKHTEELNQLFTVVRSHGQIFNQKHTIQMFKSIFDISKSEKGKNLSIQIVGDPSFERLCGILKRHSRFLDLNEIIESIKILSFVGVSSNSTIFQVLLQLIRQNINSLSVNQIMFLDFVFYQSENNHLIDSLKLAMPLVFQINLPLEIDKDDVPQLTKLLGYATQNNIHDRYISNIVTCLVLQSRDINMESAKSILCYMTRLNPQDDIHHPAHRKLIQKCFNIVLKNITDMLVDDMLKILNVIKRRVLTNGTIFYNENFFNACADYAIIKGLEFDKTLIVAKYLSRMAHTNFDLLDYLAEKALIEDLKKFRPNFIFHFINCLSNADYKPQNWNLIRERMYENQMFKNERTDLPWSRLALQLASLDSYNDELLNKIFNDEFISEYLSREKNVLDNIQMFQLYNAVVAFYPSYIGALPPADFLKKASDINASKSIHSVIKTALQEGLGGNEFLGTAIQLPSGLFVDFVVQLQNGKTPIAINPFDEQSGVKTLKDLNIHEGTEIICIVHFHKGSFSINCQRLRGHFSLLLRTIEKQGYKVLPISAVNWDGLQPSERIPYLMREIQYKYANDIHNDTISGT